MDIDKLIEKLAPDPEKAYKCSRRAESESTGFTLLMRLVMKVRKYPQLMDFMENYIKENPNEINKTNNNELTALMLAVINVNKDSSLETVQLLLDHGANVNHQSDSGYTALMLAVSFSNTDSSLETVKLLLDYGASIDQQDDYNCGWTPLVYAVMGINTNSSLETVQLLLDHYADVGPIYSYYDETEKKKMLRTIESALDKRRINELEKENDKLKKELEFYKTHYKYHPDSAMIESLKQDFLDKATK